MQKNHLDASVNSSDKNYSQPDLSESTFPTQLNTLAKKQCYYPMLYLLGNREPDELDMQKKQWLSVVMVLIVCFKEKGSQNALEGILRIALIATSMEESLPVTLLQNDTDVGVERSLLQSIITVKIKLKILHFSGQKKNSLYKSLHLLNSAIIVN